MRRSGKQRARIIAIIIGLIVVLSMVLTLLGPILLR
jgi:hypothetical protein